VAVRGLWNTTTLDDPGRLFAVCLEQALTSAVEDSATFIEGRAADFSSEVVTRWIRDFVEHVQHNKGNGGY
jgi:hypothetical protein